MRKTVEFTIDVPSGVDDCDLREFLAFHLNIYPELKDKNKISDKDVDILNPRYLIIR